MGTETDGAAPPRPMRITVKDGPESVTGTHLDTPFILCGHRDDLIAFACRILRFFGKDVPPAIVVVEPGMGRVEIAIGLNWLPDAVAAPAPAPVSPPMTAEEREAALLAGSGHDFFAADAPEDRRCKFCNLTLADYRRGIMRTCYGTVPRSGTILLQSPQGDWVATGDGDAVLEPAV